MYMHIIILYVYIYVCVYDFTKHRLYSVSCPEKKYRSSVKLWHTEHPELFYLRGTRTL